MRTSCQIIHKILTQSLKVTLSCWEVSYNLLKCCLGRILVVIDKTESESSPLKISNRDSASNCSHLALIGKQPFLKCF